MSKSYGAPRLVLLDVDGTLLDSSLRLTERVRLAIQRCSNRGVLFALVSGRPVASLRLIARKLPGVRFLVAGNGSTLVDLQTGEVFFQQTFAADVAAKLVEFGIERSFGVCLYVGEVWYACGRRDLIKIEESRSKSRPTRYLDTKSAADFASTESILKVLYVGAPSAIEEVQKELGEFTRDVSALISYPEYLEVMPRGVTKACFIDRIVEITNLHVSVVLAVGDGDNDIEMLQNVGISACVSNASAAVRQSCQLALPSNDDDGIAIVLEALVLGNSEAMGQVREL